MFLLINSLFCQNAALFLPTLALISSSLLASSVIQLPKYLKRVTCSKGTLSNAIRFCIPFGFAFHSYASFMYFLHLSPFHTPCMFYLIYLSSSAVFLLYATNTASSAYLRYVILIPLNLIPSTFSMTSFIINSLCRLKSIGDITQPCLTLLSTSTSLLTSPSHLTAACCLQ